MIITLLFTTIVLIGLRLQVTRANNEDFTAMYQLKQYENQSPCSIAFDSVDNSLLVYGQYYSTISTDLYLTRI